VQDNNQNEHSVNEQDFNAHNRVNKNYKQQEAIDEHQNPNPQFVNFAKRILIRV